MRYERTLLDLEKALKVNYRMSTNNPFQGSLFANDFLCESIVESPDWRAIDDMALDTLEASVRNVFNLFPTRKTPNESQTERI